MILPIFGFRTHFFLSLIPWRTISRMLQTGKLLLLLWIWFNLVQQKSALRYLLSNLLSIKTITQCIFLFNCPIIFIFNHNIIYQSRPLAPYSRIVSHKHYTYHARQCVQWWFLLSSKLFINADNLRCAPRWPQCWSRPSPSGQPRPSPTSRRSPCLFQRYRVRHLNLTLWFIAHSCR